MSICDILNVTGASETSLKYVGTLLKKTRVSFLSVFIMYLIHSDHVHDSSVCLLHPTSVLFILGEVGWHGVVSHRN